MTKRGQRTRDEGSENEALPDEVQEGETEGVREQAPEPYLGLNPADADRFGPDLELEIDGCIFRLPLRTVNGLPPTNTDDELRRAFVSYVHASFSKGSKLTAGEALFMALEAGFACD